MEGISGAIVILDFGGQYAHLIGSRIRRFGYHSLIAPSNTPASELRSAAGIILSGGPQSVYDKGSPTADPAIFDIGIPVLGLCYGHQWIAHILGGKVESANVKEYGPTDLSVVDPSMPLLASCGKGFRAWMSHGDEVTKLPEGFTISASSKDCLIAAMSNPDQRIYGIQCHVEVTHTEHGMDMLKAFVDLCDAPAWSVGTYKDRLVQQIKETVGDRKVFMLVSGGVDSTVAYTLLHQVLGTDRVRGLLIDTGLLRKDEAKGILEAFKPLGMHLDVEDASEEFLSNLKGVTDPEEKRAIIGKTFLDVQKRVSESSNLGIEDGWMLGQGTIYPDTIETGGTVHAATIKTHHNRIPIIEEMIKKGLVIEPLKDLYKDEVRELGESLGLPHALVHRQPFPGPGLGVRLLCAVEASIPAREEVASDQWSVASMVLPVRSVGVQGDGRTYRNPLVLFSTDPYSIVPENLQQATSIPNASKTINRVLQCVSHASVDSFQFTPTLITRETVSILQEADAIVHDAVSKAGILEQIWQFPVVLLPVGVHGGRSIVLRPIDSVDAMTASPFILPSAVMKSIVDRLNTIKGIDCVFFDLTCKPPGTIEWE
ncbi:MAG: glutamine-hydrolyzing GMP synthase [Candidatus Peribacteraceae bacterium]